MRIDCDQKLLLAFYRSTYRVLKPGFDLHPGKDNPSFQSWCKSEDIHSWTFITAWNPSAQKSDKNRNLAANREMESELKGRGYRYFRGLGIPEEGEDWEAEESFFVANMDLKNSLTMAKKFGQKAFLYGMPDMRPSLIWVDSRL